MFLFINETKVLTSVLESVGKVKVPSMMGRSLVENEIYMDLEQEK